MGGLMPISPEGQKASQSVLMDQVQPADQP